ncbi:MAG: ATP-binding protein, partial [Rhodospirillaceae bacterium]
MNTAFRPAARSEAKPLIGLYAESGCGKTWSALLLARGFVGPNGKIGMIETEGGRGEANVGREPVGQFLVRPIRGNFSPMEYGKAITDAENEKLDALIIDSASHEWEGAGGVLAMAAENQANGTKGVLVWQQPKINHQRHFMLRLMQTPIPLVIVCMRAKYPMEKKGSDWVRSLTLEPKQAEDILFEMFVHGWIDQDHKLHVTKYTLPELANVIEDGKPISIKTGQALAEWAKGGQVAPRSSAHPAAAQAAPPAFPPDAVDGAA